MVAGANDDEADRDLVGTLIRWQDFGGVWRVVARSPAQVTVSLCRCDGGEEVERLTSGDRRLLAFLDDRASSEDRPAQD
jgi:hypothetical protein